MRSMRWANMNLVTGLNLMRDRFKFLRGKRFLAEGEKNFFLLVQMRKKHIHQIIEAAAPIGIDAVFAQADGEALQREDHRGMIVAQLMDESPVFYRFSSSKTR